MSEQIQRDIHVVTAEIVTIKHATEKMVLENSIQIGGRLCEAKELIRHGNWSEYLEKTVEFSKSTANNLMRIFNEYGDTQYILGKEPKSQTFGVLNYSQAIALLALPEDDREDVVKENDMTKTTIAELKAIIAQKESEMAVELEKGENSEADKGRLESKIVAKDQILERLEQEKAELQNKVEELTAKEVTQPDHQEDNQLAIDQGVEAMRKTITKEEKKRLAEETQRKVEELTGKHQADMERLQGDILAKEKEIAQQKEITKRSEDFAEKLKKSASLGAIPEVDRFKECFDGWQREANRIKELISQVRDKDVEVGAKLQGAMMKYLEIVRQQIEGLGV